LIFFGYMAVSIVWAPDSFVSFKRWVRASGDLTMALVVATNLGGQLEGIITVLRHCGYLLVPFSIVLAKYFPDLGRSHAKHWASDEWVGVATQKNNLGMLCMVAGLWLMWEFWHLQKSRELLPPKEFKAKRFVLLLYAAMTLYLFNGGGTARSMTSIVTLAIGIVIFWQLSVWLNNPSAFRRRIAVVLGAWLVLQPGCQAIFGEPFSNLALEAIGRDPTLTGRSTLWQDCIQMGMKHPILGAGYMGFWTESTIIAIAVRNTNAPTETHNGYIEIFVELGIVGLVLFLPVILSGLAGAWRLMRADFEHGRFCVTLLIVMLIHNYSESGFPRATYLTWFVFLLAVLNVWSGVRETSEAAATHEHDWGQPDEFAAAADEEILTA
jgi:exopolysaccharide production protein ExoQ